MCTILFEEDFKMYPGNEKKVRFPGEDKIAVVVHEITGDTFEGAPEQLIKNPKPGSAIAEASETSDREVRAESSELKSIVIKPSLDEINPGTAYLLSQHSAVMEPGLRRSPKTIDDLLAEADLDMTARGLNPMADTIVIPLPSGFNRTPR